jgi:hypothetical protein
MAKRKSHHKKHHTRRKKRSMHGVGSMATNALAVIAGGVAAEFLVNTLNGNATLSASSYGKYVSAGAPIVAGVLLPKYIKSEFGKGLGAGMIAIGGLQLAKGLGVLSGMTNIEDYSKKIALAPTIQNTRGIISGMDTKRAAIMAS